MTSHKRFTSDLLLILPFLAFFFVQLVRHEMWRDELNVYGIAAASSTFGSLLWHINHEGHPLVWYLIIWLAIKVFPSVLALKIVQGFVGAGIILMIGLMSPFSRLERVLLLLSYFILFEYTVLSRMYGLCVLLILIFLWRRIHRPDSLFANTLLLGLLANTDTLGLFFSGAFGLEWIVNRYRELSDKDKVLRQSMGAALLYFATVVFCYVTIRPPTDMSWKTTGHIFFEHGFQFTHIAALATDYLVLPWLPVRFSSFIKPGHHWNPLPIEHPMLYPVALLPILAAYVLTFRRDRDLLATFGITSVGGCTFAFFVYTGNIRNWGITFIAYVAALWLQRFRRPTVPVISTILLTLSAISGVIFSALMWNRPFSNAEATANWFKSNQLQDGAIIGTPDFSAAAIAILLKRPIYFLDCRCSDNYMLFSNRRDKYEGRDMPEGTVQAFKKLHSSQLTLLLVMPITGQEKAELEKRGAKVELLAKFTGAEAPDEDFFVYKVSRTSA